MNEIAEMRRTPRIRQAWLTTMSIGLIVVGLVLFGLVAYYLYSGARSGSDEDQFDVKASPSDLPEMLAQAAPVDPVRDPALRSTGAARPETTEVLEPEDEYATTGDRSRDRRFAAP